MAKTVIVTGGSKGIGKEIVLQYAMKGYNVVIADIDEECGRKLENDCLVKNLQVYFIKTDVSQLTEIESLMTEAKKRFHSIDILINNAGVSKWVSPYEITSKEWDKVIATNLTSVMFASREAAKKMRLNPMGGKIINIASTRAIMSEKNSEAYAAAKGGILAITHALAASLGEDHIQVNAISPGWIETGEYESLREIDHLQHFSKRVGKPSDIARACLYLTIEENDFITGTNLVIDGGMTKKMIYEE
ncbi:3-ketoacyl-ACP reductase [Bacillus sp. SA1-12]|uniref:SDR family oxidoreductase n=1 Tax=Bacillus sp. SA1-12 TaxID=1455638 RepID=UPI0006271729|nr:SDR family oxidoreductase [Bacillus sp. SA1-12]KKI88662.1 3-ketoacyl-ACP reductase [Bacillus sp. SA1-12]